MNLKRDEIRQYIIKTIGRDPQDNFDVLGTTEDEIKLRVRFTTRPEDTLLISIPNHD